MKEDARYQNAEKRKQEVEDKMREKKARHQGQKLGAASGARQEEIDYMELKGIWTEVDRDECYSKTGRNLTVSASILSCT